MEIGGTKLQIIVAETPFQVLARREGRVDPAGGAEAIRQWIVQQWGELGKTYDIRALGVGFGGPVNRRTGTIVRSHQIHGWSGFPLRDWLQQLTRLPVAVENDANVAALGEAWHGAGRGCDPVFYITLGSGVGGGLIYGGRIYHGQPPGEAEVGHIRLDRSGATIESRCSGWAMNQRIRASVEKAPKGPLQDLVRMDPGDEARHLGPALAQGDCLAQQLLEELAEDLAFGLSHMVHLVHPEVIILGGGLSGLGEPLRAAVAHKLPSYLMEVFRPGPNVVLTALGRDAVPVGAIELARWA
ncbi:MAG: ROK family protein [Verrucomicrobiota bacterium]|nr:ROK family protein [Limisphaera sp.]MDW8380699.1 ROK family protein [Verrucomicrobiota bacterium]